MSEDKVAFVVGDKIVEYDSGRRGEVTVVETGGYVGVTWDGGLFEPYVPIDAIYEPE